MGKIERVLVGIIIVLGIIIFFGAKQLSATKQEGLRYKNNYIASLTDVLFFKVNDSINAARVRELELSKKEMKDYYEGRLAQTLKDLNIRLKTVESFATAAIETTNNVNTFFRDSTINDTTVVQKLTYRSKWFDIDVIKQGEDALVRAVSRDSITQVVNWNREGFFLVRFLKRKTYTQTILSSNPNSIITYSRFIVPSRLRK
jgi:hypothetical protein